MGKLSAILIVLIFLVAGCTQAVKSSSQPNSAPTATSSFTQSTPEKPTSYEATTYTNDEVGFSIKYPKNWYIGSAVVFNNSVDAAQILYAEADNRPIFDMLWVNVVPKVSDFGVATEDLLEKGYAINATIVSSKSTTLADGKTPANEIILTGVMGKITKTERYLYCLGTNYKGKTILVIASTSNVYGNKALVEEIAQTLTLK